MGGVRGCPNFCGPPILPSLVLADSAGLTYADQLACLRNTPTRHVFIKRTCFSNALVPTCCCYKKKKREKILPSVELKRAGPRFCFWVCWSSSGQQKHFLGFNSSLNSFQITFSLFAVFHHAGTTF